MGSLNPSMRIGAQVAEARRRGRRRRGGSSRRCSPRPGSPSPHVKAALLPARTLRRPAPAGDDRDGAGAQPAAGRRRRADHRARRDGSGARPRPARARRRASAASALLLVTHDLGVAARICDRIAVAYAGRIVEVGTAAADPAPRPATPIRSACSRAARGSTARSPAASCRRFRGSHPTPAAPPPAAPSPPRCPAADEACAAARARPASTGGRRCECHRPGPLDTWPAHRSAAQRRAGRLAADAAARHPGTGADPGRRRSSLEDLGARLPAPAARHPFAAAPAPLRAVDGVSLTRPGRGLAGDRRRVRLGQDDAAAHDRRAARAHRGHRHCWARAPRPQLVFQDAGASLTPWLPDRRARSPSASPALGVDARRARRAGRSRRSRPSACPAEVGRSAAAPALRAACASAPRSPARSPCRRRCSPATSPSPRSTSRSPSQVLNLLCELRAQARASRCCSSPTTSPPRARSPTRSRS